MCAVAAGGQAARAAASVTGDPDLDEARERIEVLPEAMGVEGLVLTVATSRYVGGPAGVA